MSASIGHRFARIFTQYRGLLLAQNCCARTLEKNGCRRWSDGLSDRRHISEGSSALWIPGFASMARRTVAEGSGRCGTSVKTVFEVPCTFQPILRGGQLRGYSTGFRPGSGSRVDIGARARQLQARRLWTITITGTLVAGFIIIVLNTFQENMMFYITPSQALEKYYLDPSKNKFRLGGLVLEGSVNHFKNSAEMEFVVTDLANEILVRYRGALPDLFREGHSVVAEGYLRPVEQYPGRPESLNDANAHLAEKAKEVGCFFAAVEVLAKHDEKYMPKEVAAAIEKNKAAQESAQPALLTTTTKTSVPSPIETPPSSSSKKKTVAQTPSRTQPYEIRV